MAAKKPKEEVTTPPKETPVVEPKVESKEEVKDVEIDTSKIEEEVVEAAKEKLAESLVGKKDEKWVPKDYEEVKEVAKKETLEEVDKKFEERDKQVKEDKKTKVKEDKAKLAKWDKYWQGQVTKLTDEGHLPKPAEEIQKKLDEKETLTEEEMKDPAMIARTELYSKAQDLKESNLELVYHRDLRDKQPAGASAPVLGTRKSVSPPSSDGEFAYEDITNNPSLGGPKTTAEVMRKG